MIRIVEIRQDPGFDTFHVLVELPDGTVVVLRAGDTLDLGVKR